MSSYSPRFCLFFGALLLSSHCHSCGGRRLLRLIRSADVLQKWRQLLLTHQVSWKIIPQIRSTRHHYTKSVYFSKSTSSTQYVEFYDIPVHFFFNPKYSRKSIRPRYNFPKVPENDGQRTNGIRRQHVTRLATTLAITSKDNSHKSCLPSHPLCIRFLVNMIVRCSSQCVVVASCAAIAVI